MLLGRVDLMLLDEISLRHAVEPAPPESEMLRVRGGRRRKVTHKRLEAGPERGEAVELHVSVGAAVHVGFDQPVLLIRKVALNRRVRYFPRMQPLDIVKENITLEQILKERVDARTSARVRIGPIPGEAGERVAYEVGVLVALMPQLEE